ncbi:MAG TPA: orotidine-5'-phosphate decarboxylase [Gemmatimonadales bacterium]|jgi:orotidine-5'-phosphate decarboxylase
MADLIVALDHPGPAEAVAFLDQLPDGCAVKVGSVLLTRAGVGFVRTLVAAGHPVFLDAKWYDIPNTVAGAVAAAADLGVDMVTVHASGGSAMIAAARAAAGASLKVVAVTVVTSFDAAGYGEVIGRQPVVVADEVVRLARLAMTAGADGVVCSAAEIAAVRGVVGTGRIVVPGIRRPQDGIGDQKRVAGPAEAVAAGATHLVVGRPITEAVNPAEAWQAFHASATG